MKYSHKSAVNNTTNKRQLCSSQPCDISRYTHFFQEIYVSQVCMHIDEEKIAKQLSCFRRWKAAGVILRMKKSERVFNVRTRASQKTLNKSWEIHHARQRTSAREGIAKWKIPTAGRWSAASVKTRRHLSKFEKAAAQEAFSARASAPPAHEWMRPCVYLFCLALRFSLDLMRFCTNVCTNTA